MAVEVKGTECLLQIGNTATGATGYTTLEGQTDTSFDGSAKMIETTAKDSGGWVTNVPVSVSGVVNCSGKLRGSRAQLDKLEAAWAARSPYDCQILFDAAGNGYKGGFYVSSLKITAPTLDVTSYTLALTPAAALTRLTPSAG
ncbi:phage tail tube protein [Oleisolibacter albus]|uniref:phage tail tube protein n=1 Tax=Oleisolibacter albus TaxID=2171757 RepID=UPI000DF22CE3|nr:phage tail tube protein [Oleisolibacter albus]